MLNISRVGVVEGWLWLEKGKSHLTLFQSVRDDKNSQARVNILNDKEEFKVKYENVDHDQLFDPLKDFKVYCKYFDEESFSDRFAYSPSPLLFSLNIRSPQKNHEALCNILLFFEYNA